MTELDNIGTNAGKIWHALKDIKEITTVELSRKLELSFEDTAAAVGWLARENNIIIKRKDNLLVLSSILLLTNTSLQDQL